MTIGDWIIVASLCVVIASNLLILRALRDLQ